MNIGRLFSVVCLIALAHRIHCSPLYAENAIGFDLVSGKGTSGFDFNAGLDLKPSGFRDPFETTLGYAHQQTNLATNDKTNQVTGGVSHNLDDRWNWQTEVTYWKDDVNAIHYAGPTAGFTYTWTDGSAEKDTTDPYNQIQNDFSETRPSIQNEDTAEPAAKNEIAALSINADLFFYDTDVQTSSVTRRVFDKKVGRYIQKVVPGTHGSEKVTQFHPNVTIEKPLWDSLATPYLTAGHYFYSQDPAAIEAIAGRPRFASAVNHLNGLVGGFLKNNAELGLRLSFPLSVDSDFRLGVAEEATDNTWSTTQGVTFTRLCFQHFKVKVDWSRTIQLGTGSDLYTGGLTYLF